MSNDDEIYTFKLYNFTEVRFKNDLGSAQRLHSKIYCTDRHLYLCCVSPKSPMSSADLHRPVVVWRYDFFKDTWSAVHELSCDTPRTRARCHRTLWNDLLFFRTCVFPEPSHHTKQSLYFSNLRKCGDTMDFIDVIPARATDAANNAPDNVVCPPQYYGYAMAVNDVDLYVVGGLGGSGTFGLPSMDIYLFYMRTSEWTKLYDHGLDSNPVTPGRIRHEVVYYEHGLYIFGGLGGLDNQIFSFDDIPVFDLETNSWKVFQTVGDPDMALERFPCNRVDFAIARDPHQPSVVFVNGGSVDPRQPLTCVGDTWRLDLKTLQWKLITSLSTMRLKCMHSMDTTPDGRMYLFGGVSNIRQFHEFLVAWINVPKLADMCWDAFVFYVRKGVIKLPDDLTTLGLPKRYLERLPRN